MAFGQTPTTTTEGSLASNQVFLSSVAVPGTANGDLTALEGGPISTDSNSNKTAPVSMYVKDGSNVAQGATTDTAWGGSGAGTLVAILKKIVTQLSATLTIVGTVVSTGNPTSTAALSSVAGSASSVSLLASNSSRKAFYVYNDASANLYIAYGVTASTTAYTVKVPPSTFYEMPTNPVWQGAVSGIWDSATGAARITEVA